MDAQASNNILSKRMSFLVLSSIILAVGNCGGPLIMRLYFVHGGKRIWLSSTLETVGWPILFIPLTISYFHRRKTQGPNIKVILVKYPTFLAAAAIGLMGGVTNFTYAFGVANLPVSTSALISASQLAITAFFAFLIVKQRFTPYTVNAVVLLTMGTTVLAMRASSDRPEGESTKMYVLGFVLTFASAVLNGMVLPLIELTYKKAKQAVTCSLVMEVQMVMSFFSTALCIVGMIISNDFKVIPHEAKEYQLGEEKYYVVLIFSAIIWQFYFLGAIGITFLASAMVSGIMLSALLPVTEVLAVIFFHDKFQPEKGIALALSLWGFVSHFYGGIKNSRTERHFQETVICPATRNGAP